MNIPAVYLSRARITCFDSTDANVAAAAGDDNTPRFTQAQLDEVLAHDKRAHQTQLQKVQQTLEETANAKGLEAQQRQQLAQRLEEIEASQRTKEQQEAHVKKQEAEAAAKKVADAEKTAKTWQARFQSQLIESRLNEAVNDPDLFQPSQVKQLLRGAGLELEQLRDDKGQLTDQQEVFVTNFEDRDETGAVVIRKLTPVQAVKRMKVLTGVYGNQVRSGVVSGIGGQGPGGMSNGNVGIDPRRATTEQYMQMRQTPAGRRQSAFGRTRRSGKPSVHCAREI